MTATPRARRRLVAVLACLLALPLAGCVSMPTSGPVEQTGSVGSRDEQPGFYIDPPPPQPGGSPAAIVDGFLDAMTATPIQTSDAKQFLTEEEARAWSPEKQTIIYSETLQPRGSTRVSVKLVGADHLDERGAFQGRLPRSQRTLAYSLTREDGEWRISDAPDALVVPESWFEQRFTQVSLYYFDPSARILVPEPVFVPLGEQLGTAMTRALLAGPSAKLEGVVRTFIPPGLTFGLSVPVDEEGVAELTLRGFAGRLSPDASDLLLAQVAWTLRQDPSVRSLRVTVGERQLTLPDGVGQFSVEEGSEFDPTGLQASSLLFGLRGGRLVSGPPEDLAPVDGPMGAADQGVRSIAVNLDATRVAGVSSRGDRVLVTSVRAGDEGVTQVASGAIDLLRPAWDFADRLWLVDNRPGGAQVSYVVDDAPIPLKVPGISDRRVSRFLVSRDGSRIVAVVRRAKGDVLMTSRIRHDGQGRVIGATEARRLMWQGETNLRIRDIGWSSPTSVVVLHRVAQELFQVRTISVDGSPSSVDDLLTTLTGRMRSLASSPVTTEPLYAVTTANLAVLRGATTDAALDSSVSQVGYVG